MSKKNRNNNTNSNVDTDVLELGDQILDTEIQLDGDAEEETVDTEAVDTEEGTEPDTDAGEREVVEVKEETTDALDNKSIINENTLAPVVEPIVEPVVLEPVIIPEPVVIIEPVKEVVEEDSFADKPFSKETLIEILDSTVEVNESEVNIYNTADDIIAAAKLEKIYKLSAKLGTNSAVARVMSQALKYAKTSADKRKGDTLFSTLIKEINTSTPGKDFDLLMFVVTKTFKASRTLNELAIARSFREVKNVELKQSALLLSHLICQLSTADDRKKKVGVTISLDKAVQISASGLNQNGANLVKEYFKK